MRITKGLVIAEPWIGHILRGEKSWEMRSTGASLRGWFGLVRKGSGAVVGVARLAGVGQPLSPDEMVAHFEKHRIPEPMIRSGEVAKWNVPWFLSDARALPTPIRYEHKPGSVTWVKFDAHVVDAVARQFAGLSRVSSEPTPRPQVQMEAALDSASDPFPEAPVRPPSPIRQAVSEQENPASSAARLIGEVELKEANIRNQHIYLRGFFDKFPRDAVGGSNKAQAAPRSLVIDWGGPTTVETDLDGEKKFFRARGWIRAFFETNRAEAGDKVVVEEVARYRLRVRLRAKAARR